MKNDIPEENIDAIEINKDYFEIGEARIKYWRDVDFDLYKEKNKIKKFNNQKGIKDIKDDNIEQNKIF